MHQHDASPGYTTTRIVSRTRDSIPYAGRNLADACMKA